MSEFTKDQILAAVARLQTWRHRIDVGHGVVTPGVNDCLLELQRLQLPEDLSGMRVLDVGCSDGFYSFECERRGAKEVIAVDDLSSLMNPGENGFSIAHRLRGSQVEFREMSVYDLSVDTVGTFDLILFLNVLYHLRHPMLALQRLASVLSAEGTMVLKSFFIEDFRLMLRGRVWGFDIWSRPRMRFYETTELAGDPTNWWGPNKTCLEGMLRSSGFNRIEFLCRAVERVYYKCGRSAARV